MVLFLRKILHLKKKIGGSMAMLLLCCTPLFSQNYLEVPVKVDIEKGSMDGVLVKVKKDGKDAFTQSGSSKMRLKLDFNKKYTLIFTKDGYVTKTIEFNTTVPAERIKAGFEAYPIGVKLFKQEDDKNQVVYNQAVGIIKYDTILDEFSFDTDYSKSVLSDIGNDQTADNEDDKKKDDDKSDLKDDDSKTADAGTTDKSSKKKKKDDASDSSANKNTDTKKSKRDPSSGNDVSPKGQSMAGNDVAPKGQPAGGNDVPGKSIGAGGNDNSDLTAMSDGADAGGGIVGSSGSDSNNKKIGAGGDEKLSVTQRPEGGSDSFSSSDATDNFSVTREDIVEDKRIVTIVRVTRKNTTTEYRRVIYRWGGLYYFQDNKFSISENVFAFYTGVKD